VCAYLLLVIIKSYKDCFVIFKKFNISLYNNSHENKSTLNIRLEIFFGIVSIEFYKVHTLENLLLFLFHSFKKKTISCVSEFLKIVFLNYFFII
jgi:hypothetical protein